MTIRTGFVVSLAIVCSLIKLSAGEDVKPNLQTLRVKLTDEGEKTKLRINLAMQLSIAGEFSYMDVGVPHSDGMEEPLSWGTMVGGTLKPLENGEYRLDLKLCDAHRVDSKEKSTQVVGSEVLEIRTNLILGKVHRVHCGGTVWCELRVD